MRQAELVLALVMGLLSIGLMWKSAELPIGWIPDEGPGGGAFPFWLSAGMLVCCIWILVRWVRRPTGPAADDSPYIPTGGANPDHRRHGRARGDDRASFTSSACTAPSRSFSSSTCGGLGRHSWRLTGSFAVATPIVTFFFFESALKITLPKGYTEPLFYPLYDWFL